MVRTKYLAYKGKWQELTVITREKFLEIIKSNKEATGTERRYFIADFIEESWGIDCLVIETSAEVHHKWSVEHNKVYRNRKYEIKTVMLFFHWMPSFLVKIVLSWNSFQKRWTKMDMTQRYLTLH